MALGPGKYDDLLTDALAKARERCPHIQGGLLITYAPPEHASEAGFSAQLPASGLMLVPAILRHLAYQIEADLQKGKL